MRSKIGDLSVTDSTTSKFEKLEQLIHLYNDEKSSQKEKIRYITYTASIILLILNFLIANL